MFVEEISDYRRKGKGKKSPRISTKARICDQLCVTRTCDQMWPVLTHPKRSPPLPRPRSTRWREWTRNSAASSSIFFSKKSSFPRPEVVFARNAIWKKLEERKRIHSFIIQLARAKFAPDWFGRKAKEGKAHNQTGELTPNWDWVESSWSFLCLQKERMGREEEEEICVSFRFKFEFPMRKISSRSRLGKKGKEDLH